MHVDASASIIQILLATLGILSYTDTNCHLQKEMPYAYCKMVRNLQVKLY